jgi:hypothetical protein
MGKRGPEPRPENELRTVRLSVFMTQTEASEIERRAGLVKMRTPAYLREAGLDRLPPTVPELNREAWRDLSRAAANLNQIAQRLNRDDHPVFSDLRDVLAKFRVSLLAAQKTREDDHESDAKS